MFFGYFLVKITACDFPADVWKFPFLGDVPGLGSLFRSTKSTKEKQELVIMVTPRIINDSSDIVNKGNTAL